MLPKKHRPKRITGINLKPKQILFTRELKEMVYKRMTVEEWSPELITAQWKKEKKPAVSHEYFNA